MRSNDAAADALQELADLIAISGGDPYRVRAYEKAARSVAGCPLDLDTLDRKGLIAIPAVGAHTTDKLLELRQTGHIAALEDLHAQLPAGLRALLGIPGLGPKRAHPGSSWATCSGLHRLPNSSPTTPHSCSSRAKRRVRDGRDCRSTASRSAVAGR